MAAARAIIVGAGIGGLAAALTLRRAGWEVRVVERATNPRELGFALNLAPNAMAALAELGLAERVRSEGTVPVAGEVRDGRGRLLRRASVPAGMVRRGMANVVALRPVVFGGLLDAVRAEAPDALCLGREVAGFVESHGVVAVRFTDGAEEHGDVLIGADGAGSAIRRCLHPDECPAAGSGHWALRGVARDTGRLGSADAIVHLGDGIESACVRAGRDALYWYVSLLDEDLDAYDRDPVRVAARHTAAFDPRVKQVIADTAPEDIRLDELRDRDPIDAWGRGSVTLLGDAAHPMLPHSGQGAAQALEDAIAIGLVLKPGREPAAGLREYERIRAARTSHFVRRGRRMARLTTTHSRLALLRNAVIRWAPLALAPLFLPRKLRDPHRALR